MVHDYWMYVDDPDFVKDMMPGVRAVLSFYGAISKAEWVTAAHAVVEFRGLGQAMAKWVPPAEADGSRLRRLTCNCARLPMGGGFGKAIGSPAWAQEYQSRPRIN